MRTLDQAVKEFKSTNVNEDQASSITVLEAEFNRFLEHVYNEVPDGANRTAGVRKLLEAKMTFIHAISHDWFTEQATKTA